MISGRSDLDVGSTLKEKRPSSPLAARYFLRFEEALAALYPERSPPRVRPTGTLDDFYVAARTFTQSRDTPLLGLEFGRRIRLSDYGVVGLAMASTRNLAEAIGVQLKYLGVITNTSRVAYNLTRTKTWLTLALQEDSRGRTLDAFSVEAELGAQLTLLCDLLPSADTSQCVLSLPYKCPSTRAMYEQRAGCRVRFGQPNAQLQLPALWADQPLDSADEVLAPMLADRCQLVLMQFTQGDDWVQRVRSFLLTCDSQKKSLDETAASLRVSTAKLRWQLAKSQTSYKQILKEVRMQLACRYLEDTPLTLQQIAYQLGYGYPSNFQLAFKQYFDLSPGVWRKRHGEV